MEHSIIFEEIKRSDIQGKTYWTSRDLYRAIGYSSHQKFCNLIKKIGNEEIHIKEHFNRQDEMVNIGSGARRARENYHLDKDACLAVAMKADQKRCGVKYALQYFSRIDFDFNGIESDLNCQDSLLYHEKESIKTQNRKYWEKYNTEASEYYQQIIKRLENIEEDRRAAKILEGFHEDNTFHGHKASHHIMYKLGVPLKSKDDAKRGYEFLIEYDIFEPTVGIYYGCKGLIYGDNLNEEERDRQINLFNQEWEIIKEEVIRILNNTFPEKDFSRRLKKTNNANNNTYWPFWITLYEEEDIIEVGARALRLIKDVYRKYINEESYKENLESKPPGLITHKSSQDITAFTQDAYDELLEKLKTEDNVRLFENFISSLKNEQKNLHDVEIYEKAYGVESNRVEFAYMLSSFFKYLKTISKKAPRSVPWECIGKVFMDMNEEPFGKDVLKNSYKYSDSPTAAQVNHKERSEKRLMELLKNK